MQVSSVNNIQILKDLAKEISGNSTILKVDLINGNFNFIDTLKGKDDDYIKKIMVNSDPFGIIDKEFVEKYGQEGYDTYRNYILSYKNAIDSITNSGNNLGYTGYFTKDGNAEIDTSIGKAGVILDLNDNGNKDGTLETMSYKNLLTLDDNRDGVLDSNDKYFSKLKLIVKDDNNQDKVVSASSILSYINLQDFIDPKKIEEQKQRAMITRKSYDGSSRGDTSNTFTEEFVDKKYTYTAMSSKKVDKFFDIYGDKDGWVDFSKWEIAKIITPSFAYKKKDLLGSSHLQDMNIKKYAGNNGYAQYNTMDEYNMKNSKANNFLALYNQYQAISKANQDKNNSLINELKDNNFGLDTNIISDFKSQELRDIEAQFKSMTGLDFSSQNMEKVKNLVDDGKKYMSKTSIFDDFANTDAVIAMKKDEDGRYILKFDSGRVIKVDEIYENSGDFLKLDGNKRASMMSEDDITKLNVNKDDKIDSKEIDFESIAINRDGVLQTLKDAGVKHITLLQNPQTKLHTLEMLFNTGEKATTSDLYSIRDMSNQYKITTMEQLKEYLANPYLDSNSKNGSNKGNLYQKYA